MLYKKIFKNIKKEKKDSIGYVDLAPSNNVKQGEVYFAALEWALNNPNIHNLAISGPYGSGKSSIIKSYLKKHPKIQKKSINISLANFSDASTDNEVKHSVKDKENKEESNNVKDNIHNCKSKKKIDDSELEEGILKLLFIK